MAAFLFTVTLLVSQVSTANAQDKYLYVLSNHVEDGQNSVVGYERQANGQLIPLNDSPFPTRGTGINNSTNGKLGPNDNDTPIIVSPDKRRLFAVNGHSNTIAVFDIQPDGSLEHAPGSPFNSMGIGPASLAISQGFLLVGNRNEDPHQLDELRGSATSNYASFRINDDGSLTFICHIELTDGQKNTQVWVSSVDSRLVFGNDFQVDADFDGDGDVSKLFSAEQQVRGRLNAFWLGNDGKLVQVQRQVLPETVDPAPGVPSVPLGIWGHPTKKLLYVGFVTRNQLGVYRYDDRGKLMFVTAVANSGQDLCWIRVNKSGTRLYAVNNLPREDKMDAAGTVTVFDISGGQAENPVEIQRVELPMPLGTFVNNRNSAQPNSTPFQLTLDDEEQFLYVINQRVNQTPENQSQEGNVLHILRIGSSGRLSVVDSRHLGQDGVHYTARPQGVVTIDR